MIIVLRTNLACKEYLNTSHIIHRHYNERYVRVAKITISSWNFKNSLKMIWIIHFLNRKFSNCVNIKAQNQFNIYGNCKLQSILSFICTWQAILYFKCRALLLAVVNLHFWKLDSFTFSDYRTNYDNRTKHRE